MDEDVIELLKKDAASLQQELDEACLAKLEELSADQLDDLYKQFAERMESRPPDNVSAMLFSLARGFISGRIAGNGRSRGSESSSGNGRSGRSYTPLGRDGHRDRHRYYAEVPRSAKALPPLQAPSSWKRARSSDDGYQTGRCVPDTLRRNGLQNVDDAAVQKLGELGPDDLRSLMREFKAANAMQTIHNPSKWLFSHARTILAAAAGRSVRPKVQKELIGEVPELPGIQLDEECVLKIGELDELERAVIMHEFVRLNEEQPIRNPSGWLFSKARSAVVARITGREPRVGRRAQFVTHDGDGARDPEDVLEQLAEQGVDQQALDKLTELHPEDFHNLVSSFLANMKEQLVNEPSKWLFSKARTILAQQAGKGRGKASKPRGRGVLDLGAIDLDQEALEKLAELDEADKRDLIQEFHKVNEADPIRNPSGWMFGKARTRIVQRQRGSRATPY